MKSPLLLAAVFGLSVSSLQAQHLQIGGSLSWGSVTEATPAGSLDRTLNVSNPHAVPLRIDSIRFFDMYGAGAGSAGRPFSSPNGAMDVPAGGGADLVVLLNPRHNIPHASTALICGSGIPGCRAADLSATVSYRKGYYATTQGLWGQALFSALQTKVRANYQTFSYNAARDQMFMTVDNKRVNGQASTQNRLECVYTGREAVGYTSRSDAQNSDNFNTEHTYPQSLFSSNTPMVSDLHHLFPTDNNANNARSNYPFDTVITVGSYNNAGSKLGTKNGITVFEPRAQQKGRTARAMCYFVLRHQDYSNYFVPQQAILRTWAQRYLPDTIDLKRNSDVQAYQGNRNPFVDYPQFLDRIPNLVNPGQAFPAVNRVGFYPASATLSVGDTVGYYFTLVNEGNSPVTVPFTAPPAGFTLQVIGNSTLDVGHAITYRLVPTTATSGVYTYTPVSGSSVTIYYGVTATRPTQPVLAPIRVNPNPATGQVTIQAHGPFTIYSAMGRTVYTGSAGSLDVSTWPAGVYIIRSGSQAARLIVE